MIGYKIRELLREEMKVQIEFSVLKVQKLICRAITWSCIDSQALIMMLKNLSA